MKRFFLVLGLLAAGLSALGCSEAEKPPPPQPAPPPPVFTRADEPRAFFDDYLADLGSERFLPADLVELLTGQTDLDEAIGKVRRQHTHDFLRWYYAADYLAAVDKAVQKKLDNLAYQLDVLDVAREDAEPVLMVIHSGIVEQKQIVGAENFVPEWEEGQEAFRIRLSGGGKETYLLLFQEQGEWKLGVLQPAAEIAD